MLMKNQGKVSPKRGLPVDRVDDSQKIVDITGETVQLYFYNSGTLTSDAGEAAGTLVIGKFSYGSLLGELGNRIGSYGNSSLDFTSTGLTEEIDVSDNNFEAIDYLTPENGLKQLAEGLSNGQYVIDYRFGMIFGKKADTSTELTAVSYKINSTASNVTLEPGDIKLGAVEIKGTSGTRADVTGGSLHVDVENTSFDATQTTAANLKSESHIHDGSGNVIDSTANALNVETGLTLSTLETNTSNLKAHSETAVLAAANQTLTTDYVVTNNMSSIDCDGYNNVSLLVRYQSNDSEGIKVKVAAMSGDNTFEFLSDSEFTVYTAGDDTNKVINVELGAIRKLKIYVKADTLGNTAGEITDLGVLRAWN